MSTGRYYFTIYYSENLKLSLSFNTNLVDESLLALRRVTFGMSTGRCYFTIYYFPACSPSNAIFNKISPIFPFSLLPSTEFETFLSFNANLKRNLVLASPRSLLARRRITFGTSTGHFWHVDGSFWHVDSSHLACRRSFWHVHGTDPML